jgi:hypothetical protein
LGVGRGVQPLTVKENLLRTIYTSLGPARILWINEILPVVLYGCETCSLTLKEEHRLRVFENRVLRRIFGPKRDEVMG